jgi:hypothetical protein
MYFEQNHSGKLLSFSSSHHSSDSNQSVVVKTNDNDYDQMLSSLFDLSESSSFQFEFDTDFYNSINSISVQSDVDSKRETIIAGVGQFGDETPDPNRATFAVPAA